MTAHPIQLIVGLGNPGKTYVNTRHNAGAWFVEYLAKQTRTTLKLSKQYHGIYGTVIHADHTYHLLIPTTFMNDSGRAMITFLHYHAIMPCNMLVAHDEIDLPVETIKLKFDGGDGGHNGLKSIIQHLHTKQFYRLRIGIGRPKQATADIANYVLKPPSQIDRRKINATLEKAYHVLPDLLTGRIQQAMTQLHTVS